MSTPPAHVTLHDEIDALLAESGLPAAARQAVRDALGQPPPREQAAVTGVYLGAVAVSGFRGIGRTARLPLEPRNGLTLITGRNGSGKSSFAEAIEIALTGENSRWKNKSQVWTGSFANLHTGGSPEIEVELLVAGEREPVLVNRYWTGPQVGDSEGTVTRPGRTAEPLDALGLGTALTDFRPFLPYAELGGALDRPSEIHDRISAILGLGGLADACKRLREQVLALQRTIREAKEGRQALAARLAAAVDPRAVAVREELARRNPDLDRIGAVLAGGRHDDPRARTLRDLAGLAGPDPQAVRQAADRLRAALRRAEHVRGTAADDARARAELLERALAHHRRHAAETACPVCGAPDRLDAVWARRAEAEIARLRAEAAAAEAALRELDEAGTAAADLITTPPRSLPERLGELWREWASLRGAADPDRYLRTGLRLAEECRTVRENAAKELSEQEDGAWQEVAAEVTAWYRLACDAARAQAGLGPAKEADAWLRAVHDRLRDERMAAQGQDARAYWQIMRQQSNVVLGEIRLAGKGSQRRAELDVRVDDVSGAALGVMSQGELHALALSLFLPRALAARSPFRFLVVDDPVQSMDPAKVDGLAQLLDEVAKRRQVVVFTHDSRLPEAVRRLRIPATILEVARRERSEVDVRPSDDPVDRALRDARTIAAHRQIPPQVGPVVLPGLCRVALEAAFVEVARRRLLAAGEDHHTTERRVADARATGGIASLALGVPQHQVRGWLDRRFGRWAGEVYAACNEGSHEPQVFHTRLRGLGDDPIEYVTRLTRRLREVA